MPQIINELVCPLVKMVGAKLMLVSVRTQCFSIESDLCHYQRNRFMARITYGGWRKTN